MTMVFSHKNAGTKALSVLLALIMVLTALPIGLVGALAASNEPLRFATLSDLHYYSPEKMGNKDDGFKAVMSSNCVLFEDGLLDSAFAAIEKSAKENGLKYVLISGDLTYNGEKAGHEALAKKLEEFEERTGLTVFVTNGNHDINNSSATEYVLDEATGTYHWVSAESTTPEEFKDIYANLGYDKAVSTYTPAAGKAGMLSYSAVLDGGYRLITIDAGKYSKDNTEKGLDEHETGGNITPALMQWVLNQISEAKANGEIPIAMTHWNIGDQNYFTTVALQGFEMDNWQEVAETLADAGLHYVFTGHTHDTDLSSTVSDNGETLYNITTPSLQNFPNQYRENIFVPGNDGSVTATFEKHDVDEVLPVTADGITYDVPFKYESFKHTYGETGNIVEYLEKMAYPMIRNLFANIKNAGGLIPFIENTVQIDLEQYLNNLLHGGLMINGKNIVTAKNVMGLLNDIASQIETKFIDDPDYTLNLVHEFLVSLAELQVSDEPCSKFVDEYGFGSYSDAGTLSDLALSIFIYKSAGNEDITDDPFMQNVIERLESGELADEIIGLLRTELVDKVILNELLGSININLKEFFVDFNTPEGAQIYQIIKKYASPAALKKIIEYYVNEETLDLYNQVISETLALVGIEGIDLLGIVTGLIGSMYDPSMTDFSIKGIAEKILSYGILEKYGKSVDEVITYFLDLYITDEVKQGVGYQLALMLRSFVEDENPQFLGDFDVTYTYNGPVPVDATVENLRLPSMIAPTYGSDSSSEFNLSWTTKYSVKDTDIELYAVKDGASFPEFTGVPTVNLNIKAKYENLTREYYGVDFGVAGMLKYEEKTVRHTVTLKNLEPDTKYVYRVGSASKGWWSEVGSFTTGAADKSEFTFFHMTDTQAVTPSQYENGWANVLDKAYELYPEARFVLHTGDFVDNGANFKQWQWFFNSASDMITNSAIMPVSGNHDAKGLNSVANNFNVDYDSTGFQYTDTGIYYSFDYNNAHFAIINSNDLQDNGELTKEQLEWLTEDMNSSDADWKIVAFHKAVYSNGSHYADKDVKGLRSQLSTLMPELQVDLVLNGHDHVYFRTAPLNNNTVDNKYISDVIYKDGTAIVEAMINPDGTIYSINGSAGIKSYAGVSSEETKDLFPDAAATYPSDNPIFTAITIEGENLVFKSYAVNGDTVSEIDSFGIIKGYEELKLGDVDLNGNINSKDARLALRYALNIDKITGYSLKTADVNFDDKITTSDARTILRFALKLEQPDPEFIKVK